MEKIDDPIVSQAHSMGIECFRGSERDVLHRYYYAAKISGAEAIVRITADCPLVDPEIVDHAVQKFFDTKCDYISNTRTRTYPHGLDVEVFSFATLEKTNKETSWAYDRERVTPYMWKNPKIFKYDREHVTPYMWKNPKIFKVEQLMNKEDLSHIRVTVDYPKDLDIVRKIFSVYGVRACLKDIKEADDID